MTIERPGPDYWEISFFLRGEEERVTDLVQRVTDQYNGFLDNTDGTDTGEIEFYIMFNRLSELRQFQQAIITAARRNRAPLRPGRIHWLEDELVQGRGQPWNPRYFD